jgi:hypothetical protein
VADTLGRQIDDEPQLYGRLLRGEVALERSDVRGALAAFQDAHKIADSWLEHFGLGRAYVLAGKFTEASTEFEWCEQHSGQAIAILLDDVPTWRLIPTLQYFMGRTLEGLNSPAAGGRYKAFLATKEKGDEQGLVADARRRVQGR